jgi:hypothetical protein
MKDKETKKIYEFPLFPFQNGTKSGITWIKEKNEIKSFVVDQFQQTIFTYDEKGNRIVQCKISGGSNVSKKYM